MKNRRIKPILVLALTALLLTVTVSGTLAYLSTKTEEVVNTFEPTQVSVTVSDKTEGNVKKEVVITNTSDIDVYIRAAIVGNWQNVQDGQDIVVDAWTNDIDAEDLGNGWEKGSDGYYYYKFPVEPKGVLTGGDALFNTYTAGNPPTNLFGETADHLQLDILVQAIQAEPANAVVEAWRVTVDTDGTISKP